MKSKYLINLEGEVGDYPNQRSSVNWSVNLNAELRKAMVETQFIKVSNGGHGQNFPYRQVNQSIQAFADYHLQGRGDKPVDGTLEAAK